MENNEIYQVFQLQKNHKYKMRNTSARYRLRKLKELKKTILLHTDEINQALSLDFNKPALEVQLTEIMPIISYLNLLEENLKDWMQDAKVSAPIIFKGTNSFIRYEGKGNVLSIGPWNYPFQLSLYPLITSFAAGNTTLLKPSEFTKNTNEILIKILSQVFSPEEVSVIEGEAEVVSQLLEFRFDHIFFTGSTQVGKIIMEKASKHLTSVSLELGGKSPAIVWEPKDIKDAAYKIMWGKLVNAGQTCVAPDYVLIDKKIKDDFIRFCKEAVFEFYQEDFQKDYNQIITERHAKRLNALVEDAESKGAVVHRFGEVRLEERIIPPILLENVDNDMKVMQEEIFGPLLPIMTFSDYQDMSDFINTKDNALAMYVFTQNKNISDHFLETTSNGGVTINDTLLAVGHAELPFGGAGPSGIGRYHGKFGFEEFSHLRSVMKRELNLGASYFYPPYTARKQKIVEKILKSLNRLF